jgi:hypothetical protein
MREFERECEAGEQRNIRAAQGAAVQMGMLMSGSRGTGRQPPPRQQSWQEMKARMQAITKVNG